MNSCFCFCFCFLFFLINLVPLRYRPPQYGRTNQSVMKTRNLQVSTDTPPQCWPTAYWSLGPVGFYILKFFHIFHLSPSLPQLPPITFYCNVCSSLTWRHGKASSHCCPVCLYTSYTPPSFIPPSFQGDRYQIQIWSYSLPPLWLKLFFSTPFVHWENTKFLYDTL